MSVVAVGQLTITDVNDGLSIVLSNESHTVPANDVGTGATFTGAQTTVKVLSGGKDVTSEWAIQAIASSGVTGSMSSTTYTVTNLTVDVGTVDFVATKIGNADLQARFTIAKAKAGTGGITAVLSNEAHTVQASNSGVVSSYLGSGTTIQVFEGTVALSAVSSLTANGQFTIGTPTLSVSSAITVGGRSYSGTTATVAVHSAMNSAVDSVSITYPISVRTRNGTTVNVNRVQVITKSKQGDKGGKGDKGDQGAVGRRGTEHTYVLRTASTWDNAAANGSLSGGPIVADRCTQYYPAGKWSETRYYTGSAWAILDQVIDGNLLVTESVTADAINLNSLYSRTATITGTLDVGNQTNYVRIGGDDFIRAQAGEETLFLVPKSGRGLLQGRSLVAGSVGPDAFSEEAITKLRNELGALQPTFGGTRSVSGKLKAVVSERTNAIASSGKPVALTFSYLGTVYGRAANSLVPAITLTVKRNSTVVHTQTYQGSVTTNNGIITKWLPSIDLKYSDATPGAGTLIYTFDLTVSNATEYTEYGWFAGSIQQSAEGGEVVARWGNISEKPTYLSSANSWGGQRHQTAHGYIDFGPANSDHAHIYTDRPNFYLNKDVWVNGQALWRTGNAPATATRWPAFSEVTGTAAVAQIPSLDASKVTSGTFAAARIPTGISITGNAGATTRLTKADVNDTTSDTLHYFNVSANTNLNPTSDWFNTIRMGHGNPVSYYSSTLSVKMTGPDVGSLWSRVITNGNAGGWRRFFADDYHPEADKWTNARTLTIGNTGKTVDGTGNVSWSLSEIGASPRILGVSAPTNINWDNLPTAYPFSDFTGIMTNTGVINGPSSAGLGSIYHYPQQIFFSSVGAGANVTQIAWPYRVDDDRIAIRSRFSGVWSTWREILTSISSLNASNLSGVIPTGNLSGTYSISITGNAGTVTNGVYTTGTQSIGGNKTFTSWVGITEIRGDSPVSFLTLGGGAREIRAGKLLVSDSYNDNGLVPANGIYTKGQARLGSARIDSHIDVLGQLNVTGHVREGAYRRYTITLPNPGTGSGSGMGNGRWFVRVYSVASGAVFIGGRIRVGGSYSYGAAFGVLEREFSVYTAQNTTSVNMGESRISAATGFAATNYRISEPTVVGGWLGFYVWSANSNSAEVLIDAHFHGTNPESLSFTAWGANPLPAFEPVTFTSGAVVNGTLTATNLSGNGSSVTNVNAATLSGFSANSGASGNTIALRDSAADVTARLFRSTYQNEGGINGAIAFRNSTTDNYIRFCSDQGAIRTWLNVPNTAGLNASGTWGISISGTAAVSTTLNHQSKSNQNLDTAATAGRLEYFEGASVTGAPNTNWHSIISVRHNNSAGLHGFQLAYQFTTDSFSVRGTTGSSYRPWLRLYTDNYHPEADKLTTARTIGGVSFDGTANINLPGVNTTGNQNTTGNAASATVLQTSRNINRKLFNGSQDIEVTEWFHSFRDFPNGTLVTTDINYAVSSGDPWVLEVKGNSYGSGPSFDLQAHGYIYNNSMLSVGGLVNGFNMTGIVAMNIGGNLCFWWPRYAYWQGFNVRVYTAHATQATNRVVSITNSADPGGTKRVTISDKLKQSLREDNFSTWAVPQTDVSTSGGASKVLKTGTDGYLYLDNWIRAGASAGLHWTTGSHFYSTVNGGFRLWGGSTASYLELGTAGNAVRGSLYANSSNEIGLINNAGSWIFRGFSNGDATLTGRLSSAGLTSSSPVLIAFNTLNGHNYDNGSLQLRTTNGSSPSLSFHRSGFTACQLRHDSNGLILSGTAQTTPANFRALGEVTADGAVRAGTLLVAGSQIQGVSAGTSWIDGHRAGTSAAIRITNVGSVSAFHSWISQRTPNGGWAQGVLGDSMFFNWATNANIDGSVNASTQALRLESSGRVVVNNQIVDINGVKFMKWSDFTPNMFLTQQFMNENNLNLAQYDVIQASFIAAGVLGANLIATNGFNVVSAPNDPVQRKFTLYPGIANGKIAQGKLFHFRTVNAAGDDDEDLFYIDTQGEGYFKGSLARGNVDSKAISESAKRAINPYYTGDPDAALWTGNQLVGSGGATTGVVSIGNANQTPVKPDERVTVVFEIKDSYGEQSLTNPNWQSYTDSTYTITLQRRVGTGSWVNVPGQSTTYKVAGYNTEPYQVEDRDGRAVWEGDYTRGFNYNKRIEFVDIGSLTGRTTELANVQYRLFVNRTVTGIGTSGGLRFRLIEAEKDAFIKNTLQETGVGGGNDLSSILFIDKESGYATYTTQVRRTGPGTIAVTFPKAFKTVHGCTLGYSRGNETGHRYPPRYSGLSRTGVTVIIVDGDTSQLNTVTVTVTGTMER